MHTRVFQRKSGAHHVHEIRNIMQPVKTLVLAQRLGRTCSVGQEVAGAHDLRDAVLGRLGHLLYKRVRDRLRALQRWASVWTLSQKLAAFDA